MIVYLEAIRDNAVPIVGAMLVSWLLGPGLTALATSLLLPVVIHVLL